MACTQKEVMQSSFYLHHCRKKPLPAVLKKHPKRQDERRKRGILPFESLISRLGRHFGGICAIFRHFRQSSVSIRRQFESVQARQERHLGRFGQARGKTPGCGQKWRLQRQKLGGK